MIRSTRSGRLGKIGGGQCPTDERLVGMKHLPAPDELILVAPRCARHPRPLRSRRPSCAQEIVGDLGPSIGVAIAFPRSGQREHFGFRGGDPARGFLGHDSPGEPEQAQRTANVVILRVGWARRNGMVETPRTGKQSPGGQSERNRF